MRFLALLVCGMFALVAYAAQTNTSQETTVGAPQGQPGTVQGKVLQEPDDQPIRKANVELSSGDRTSGEKYSTTTDVAGRFKFEDLKPGNYSVTVLREGYFAAHKNDRRSAIVVQAGESNSELIFHLQRCAVITGTIVDADGDPMRGVSLSVILALPRVRKGEDVTLRVGSTDDLGEFRLPDLRPGRYFVFAEAPPGEDPESTGGKYGKKERSVYTTTYYPSTSNREQAVPVEVHAGEEVPIRFGLLTTRAFRVSGMVTGLPAGSTGVRVMLTPKSSPMVEVDRESQEMETDGKFAFKGVMPGVYTARVMVISNTSGGGPPSAQFLKLSPTVEVNEANVDGVRLQPEPVGQVHGKVRMDNGQTMDWTRLQAELTATTGEELQRITGMTSSFSPDLSGANGESLLNKDGTFEMRNVPAETFLLQIAVLGNTPQSYFVKSVTLGGREVTESGFVAGPDTNLDVVISANVATIEGTVVNEQGQPFARALVEVAARTEQQVLFAIHLAAFSDANGHFRLRGLHPGKYMLLAFEDLEGDLSEEEVMKKYGGKGENVTVEEGAKKSVTLKVIPADSDRQ